MIVDVHALAKRWNLPAPWLVKLVSEVLAEAAGIEGLKKPSIPPALPDFEARAALAQSEPEVVGPTDEEIIQEAIKAELVYRPVDEEPYVFGVHIESHSLNKYVLNFARAVLARYGHRPAPPAEGEVAELVAALRSEAINCTCSTLTNGDLRRAADLLGQHHPAPVPVAERLPGPEDCDGEGRVWWLGVDTWMLRSYALIEGTAIPLGTHWLPATALPLPAGEVE